MTKSVLNRTLSKHTSPCIRTISSAARQTNSKMLLTVLLTFATLAAARSISPSALRVAEPKKYLELSDDSCTFTLWHRQQSSVNYIQLNTILDHANDIRIDVAAQRAAAGFNSYTRLDEDHVFAVTGLLDDKNLTITHLSEDELRFEIGEVKWSTQQSHGRAGCNAWEWEGNSNRRVRDVARRKLMVHVTDLKKERRLMCSFPCEKVDDADREDTHGGLQEEEGQVRIGLQ